MVPPAPPQRVRVLTTAPWRRAPMLLLRHRRLLAAVLAVGLVLGFVAATPLLFLSSVSSAALTRQLDVLCRGTSIDPTRSTPDVSLERLAAAASEAGGFLPPISTRLGGRGVNLVPLQASAGGDATVSVQLGTRTGWRDHLGPGDIVEGTPGTPGVWLSDLVAGPLGLGAGDTVTFGGAQRSVERPVAGVYRDFVGREFGPYWCPLEVPLGNTTYFAVDAAPPPLVLVDESDFAELSATFDARVSHQRVELPLAELPRTLDEGRKQVDRLERLDAALADDPHPVVLASGSRLPYAVRRADAIRTRVGAAVAPMAVVSVAVALGLAVGLAGFWLDRRRTELHLLWTRGAAPWQLGLKGGLELGPPLLVGAVVGWGAALATVRAFGPSPDVDTGTPARALVAAGAALVAGLVLAAVVVARRVRAGAARSVSHRRRVAFPWEVPVLLGAAWSLVRLREAGVPTLDGDALPPVDLVALAFPLLFLTGTIGLSARLLRGLLAAMRRKGDRWRVAWWLAGRRLAAERRDVLALVGLSALAVGVVVYGAGLVRSTESTVDAKAGVETGGAIVARLTPAGVLPDDLAGRATLVRRNREGTYAGREVDLLVVDPDTLLDAAWWDPAFADEPVRELLGRLRRTDTQGRAPALAVGFDAPPSGSLSPADRPNTVVEVAVVGEADVFPGNGAGRPLLVLGHGTLGAMEDGLEQQLWAEASLADVRAAVTDAGLSLVYAVPRERVTDTSGALPVVWTFAFVQLLGVLVGLLAIAALLVYVDVRQRARTVAYGLARRMGLGTTRHVAVLTAELATLVVVATGLGVALGWVAVRLAAPHLDPLPGRLPLPLLRFPWPTGVGIGVLAVLAAASAVAVAQWSASRAELAGVLREDL